MNRPQSPDIYHQVRLAAANHRASHVCLQLMELRCHQNTVDEYQAEVLEHLLHIESSALPNLSLIQQQPEMNLKMRPLLLDFLMDVVNKLSLSKSTFPLTVNLIDRYCLTRIVKKSHYQLLGLTALWVACKNLDSKQKIPSLDDLCKMCCNCYQKRLFLEMEKHLLKSLDWNVSYPTFDAFIDLYITCAMPDLAGSKFHLNDIKVVSVYICELVQFYPNTYFNYLALQASLAAFLTAILILRLPVNVAQVLNRINLHHSTILAFTQYQLLFQQLLKILKCPPPSLKSKYFNELSRFIGLMRLLIAFTNENTEPVTPKNSSLVRPSHNGRLPPTPVSSNISPRAPVKHDFVMAQGPVHSPYLPSPNLPSPNVSPQQYEHAFFRPPTVSDVDVSRELSTLSLNLRKRSHQLLVEENVDLVSEDTLKRTRSTRPVFFIS